MTPAQLLTSSSPAALRPPLMPTPTTLAPLRALPGPQTYAASWQAPVRQTPAPTPAPAPAARDDGGFGGFVRGLGRSASEAADAVTTAVAAPVQAIGTVAGATLRGGRDIVVAAASSTAHAVSTRASSAASVIGTGARGAWHVASAAAGGAGSVLTSAGRGALDVGRNLFSDPVGAATRAGTDLSVTVAQAGGRVAGEAARAGSSLAGSVASGVREVAAADVRGVADVGHSLAEAGAGAFHGLSEAGGQLVGGLTSAGEHLRDAGQTLGRTVTQAGADVLDTTVRIGAAAAETARDVGHVLSRPFDTSHHPTSPITPPGGLGTEVGGVGTRADVLRSAELARAAYTPAGESASLPDGSREATPAEIERLGLTPAMLSDPAAPGYNARVFASEVNGRTQYTIGFGGTDDLADVVTDGKQAFGVDTASYAKALEIGRALTRDPSVDVNFVGHSLGGGLAAQAAVASGRHADTFNAAGLHGTELDRALDVAGGAPGAVDNYRVEGEILTTIQEVPAARGAAGGVLGGLVAGPLGVPAGALGGANIDTPAAYGRQHDTPFVAIEGRSGNVLNRHTMDFVLASIGSLAK